ncbi:MULTISPECIES: hypothetical protein [Burkholderia]|nr:MULTISPECIES: hypothetical protein [Burkholderia]EKS9798090.1 hypothetical protein [Burkholderia cepacia]EKS9805151.1 hypothetical protein [Burkholderia cepacia]EKS9812196.1 hypothetical protein [Burkholderia cepacia]EKS9822199.1 hypothetical protein [Burkholderia cepacia]EKS9829208.1 hypothetical protein [Burkholderia cepacia]
MHQALPVQPRARAFGLTHRVLTGIGWARFAFAPLPAIFVTQGLPAQLASTGSAQ